MIYKPHGFKMVYKPFYKNGGRDKIVLKFLNPTKNIFKEFKPYTLQKTVYH